MEVRTPKQKKSREPPRRLLQGLAQRGDDVEDVDEVARDLAVLVERDGGRRHEPGVRRAGRPPP